MNTKKRSNHRPERPVNTCGQCMESVPQGWKLWCPVFNVVVKYDEKACIYMKK